MHMGLHVHAQLHYYYYYLFSTEVKSEGTDSVVAEAI